MLGRKDVAATIVATYQESVSYTVIPSTTIETVITGETTGITITGTETTASVTGYNNHTTFDESAYTFSCSSTEGSSCDALTMTTFYWPTDTPIVISYDGTTEYFELNQAATAILEVSVSEDETRRKRKHSSIFIVYNGVDYHIPSVVIFSNGKR